MQKSCRKFAQANAAAAAASCHTYHAHHGRSLPRLQVGVAPALPPSSTTSSTPQLQLAAPCCKYMTNFECNSNVRGCVWAPQIENCRRRCLQHDDNDDDDGDQRRWAMAMATRRLIRIEFHIHTHTHTRHTLTHIAGRLRVGRHWCWQTCSTARRFYQTRQQLQLQTTTTTRYACLVVVVVLCTWAPVYDLY